ncbi:hypothetical protein EJ04DRAFT_563457 [Polyplosphaeria fusca]|uniref:lytic cellulose monooxygenase (C4-dehydrogenating) n=1 Tax=Polyplosphaeria fusca TaxID=682080 RepID=A0A9P4QYN6_9PLEO|nr:hypothetical protein EJ04DRAFT_563457 [Polyplosphaeria fusca]
MGPFAVFGVLALLSSHVYAHWTFCNFLVNGTETEQWRYVRDVAQEDGTFADSPMAGKSFPQQGLEIYSTNITCGRSAIQSASRTETATVLAGSEVGFRVNDNGTIFHPGVTQFYMAAVPSGKRIEEFAGNEDDARWFKVASLGAKSDTEWITHESRDANFTVPKTTPPGQYLLRIEHLWPQRSASGPQWYVNCAQVQVVGPGGGAPEEFARFPGTYEVADPGIWLQDGERGDPQINLLRYVPPGPKVWLG